MELRHKWGLVHDTIITILLRTTSTQAGDVFLPMTVVTLSTSILLLHFASTLTRLQHVFNLSLE